jgi:hypothetical protein
LTIHLKYLPSPPGKARIKDREEHIRESWVRAMEARLVGDELKKCQKSEGVNHYENCRWLSEKYTTMLRENKVRVIFEVLARAQARRSSLLNIT